ncbi:TBC1 domain family member 5-like isoform X2 [Stylophora pistillata]|uniref:TBC1 domain family member 5-like isoform X2 n=1 Tax=Stylophora pistillata TaxID=50429 RepID=UPI000C04BBA5|nr:TBC1 domain family member 5-like isoform X2 [Stylophora pistillata]
MDKNSGKENNISPDDILKALDRFGNGSKTPSPVEEDRDDPLVPGRLSFLEDPLGTQRLSFISADGSEIDSDYSSASSVVHLSEEQKNLEQEWEVLFGSTTYYTKIRQHALDGKLRFCKFRSVCWKVFLECLPDRKDEWITKTAKLRNDYVKFKNNCLFDPNKEKNEDMDLSVFNPLSQEEASPWKQYFVDNELKSTIKQDLDRLSPEIEFFQQSKVKEMMLNILFCHAKKNEALSYKQGMHELLAPIVYVLTEDAMIYQHIEGSSLGMAKVLMDPKYLEHDAFALFVQLMDQTETWYLQIPVKGLPERNKFLDPHVEPFTDQEIIPSTAIVKKLNRIQEHMLRKYDPELWVHLKNLDITPQVYGLRWIRLLFGREFPMDDVLVLWDALFADGPMLDLVDYIYISMLKAIRNKLLSGSYSVCIGYLMKFPRVYDDVFRYVKTALTMRENKPSSSRSSPRSSRPSDSHPMDSSGTLAPRKGPNRPQSAFTSFTKRYQQFIEPTRPASVKPAGKTVSHQTSSVNNSAETEEELIFKSLRPARPASVPAPELRERTDSGSHSTGSGKSLKSLSNPLKGKLMARPRTRSRIEYDELAQDHERLQKQVSSLKSELDKMQGLYLYCGRKMDSYVDLLQDELTKEEDCVRDIVYLCLAGLKQVRDLLKGTLAFRGSTIETECDFMEIDNNIASRLEIPPQNQQKDSEIPENLPVPMMANFGHFENSDETESSFISGDVQQGNFQESEHFSEVSKENKGKEFSMTSAEIESIQQQLRELETITAEVRAGKHDRKAENAEETLATHEGGNNDDAQYLVSPLNGGNGILESTESNSLLHGEEGVSDTKAQRNVENSELLSHDKPGGEDEICDGDKEDSIANDFQRMKGSRATSCDTNPLCDTDSQLSLPTSDPLTEGESSNDTFSTGVLRSDSPCREFVFVNHDGTADNELKPKSHPLESSGEF